MKSTAYLSVVLLVIIAACFLFEASVYPGYKFTGAARLVAVQSLHLIVVALGTAMVISAGEIDLSSAGMISFAVMAAALLAHFDVIWWISWSFIAIVALGIGVIHGVLVTTRGMSSFVVTLGTSFFLSGVAAVIFVYLMNSDGNGGGAKTGGALLGSGTLKAEYLAWAAVSCYLVALFTWRYGSQRGLIHIAVGMNRAAAELAGLPVAHVIRRAFLISALSGTLAGALLLAYLPGGSHPQAGAGYELLAIAACVIGGTRLTGGYFSPGTIVVAAFLLRLLYHMLAASEVPTEALYAATGLLLLLVAFLCFGRE